MASVIGSLAFRNVESLKLAHLEWVASLDPTILLVCVLLPGLGLIGRRAVKVVSLKEDASRAELLQEVLACHKLCAREVASVFEEHDHDSSIVDRVAHKVINHTAMAFSAIADCKDHHFKIILAVVKDNVLVDVSKYRYPPGEPSLSTVEELKSKSTFATCIQKKRIQVLEDIIVDARKGKFTITHKAGAKGSLICYPVMTHIGSRVLFVLSVYVPFPRKFSAEDTAFYNSVLDQFASHLVTASVLSNAKPA